MSRYINSYTDFGFKKLFGEEANKELLLDFLNTFLPEKHRVRQLKFRNTEQLGPSSMDHRAVYDIFCEAESGEMFIVEMQKAKQFTFLQMPLFKKTESELTTHQDKWFYFLKNLVNFDCIPEILNEPIFERAFATAEVARLDKSERKHYEANLQIYRDNYAVTETAFVEGKIEGLEEGRIEEKIEIARSMKQDGMNVAQIAKYTGLSLEEVNQIM